MGLGRCILALSLQDRGEIVVRVRGFRQAPREAIVRQFIAVPGRLRITRDGLVAVIEPLPSSVALNISGAAEALDAVPWLDGRRLEIVLEGL